MGVPGVALCTFIMCSRAALSTFKILQDLLYLYHEGRFKIDQQELVHTIPVHRRFSHL